MEQKTKVNAATGQQDLTINREFDLPLELLFKAYTEPELLGQWMGTKVLQLENKKYGCWQIETTDAKGNVVFRANGVIHEFVPNQKLPARSKWKMHLSACNWNSSNLNS